MTLLLVVVVAGEPKEAVQLCWCSGDWPGVHGIGLAGVRSASLLGDHMAQVLDSPNVHLLALANS